ncbi:MAG: hypothetical protein NC307_00350 [Roseburia sp.]|nr:hypothetical protein [Roseburia sp.]
MMKTQCSAEGKRYAAALASDLKNGVIEKDYRPNHGSKFEKGLADIYQERFERYLSSCGNVLMDIRLAQKGSKYEG